MNLQELAVLIQEQIPVKIALINNGYLGHGAPVAGAVLAGNYQHVDLALARRTSSSWRRRTASRPGG